MILFKVISNVFKFLFHGLFSCYCILMSASFPITLFVLLRYSDFVSVGYGSIFMGSYQLIGVLVLASNILRLGLCFIFNVLLSNSSESSFCELFVSTPYKNSIYSIVLMSIVNILINYFVLLLAFKWFKNMLLLVCNRNL